MTGRTICVLADSVVFPLRSSMDKFRDEYEAHMRPSARGGGRDDARIENGGRRWNASR